MAGKKKSKKLEGEEEDPSDEEDSEMERQMEAFDSNEPWSELDDLENHLFNGSHEVSSPQDMPKKPKKRDRKKQREQQIAEYQQALKICQQKNHPYINPFQPYSLNVSQEQYKKVKFSSTQMLSGAVDGTTPPQGVARMTGIKSMRILHQQKTYQQFRLVKQFLFTNRVPEWIKQAHEFLVKNDQNLLFKPPQWQFQINHNKTEG